MEILNIIEEFYDGKDQERDWTKIEGLAIHRVGIDKQTGSVIGYDGPSICSAFLGLGDWGDSVAKYTGHQNAYTLYIGGDLGPAELDGKAWQALPLDEIGHHGRRYSRKWLGLALIGDARYVEPSRKQRDALVELCVMLCGALGLDPLDQIRGHGELPGSHDGSKAPGKPAACPGDLLNMDLLRADVSAFMREPYLRDLDAEGLTYD